MFVVFTVHVVLLAVKDVPEDVCGVWLLWRPPHRCQDWYRVGHVGVTVSDTLKEFPTIELQHDKTNKMAYTPSEDLDQPGHPPSLISPREEALGPWVPTERTAKTLISLGGCPGWPQSLCAHVILLVLTCYGSNYYPISVFSNAHAQLFVEQNCRAHCSVFLFVCFFFLYRSLQIFCYAKECYKFYYYK